ncbi:hypothetical protein DFH28DRAFT_1153161 [Melampsora americana]|nr:hypothetical protein DFH28DRAFT_1153161 [Melampsora americana]
MANPSSNPPAEIDLTGPLNNLFELPDERVGDDQGAIRIKQNPLHRPGTPARIQFNQKNEMTIEVRFKIYTPTTVDINIPSPTPDKVGAGKKAAKSIKLNLLNSKKMKGKYLEIKTCLFGKSLNEFKKIVADACEGFQGGMKSIVLNTDLSPELKWKTTVGRTTQVLDLVEQWQAFVTALEKSIKRVGLVVIENENREVQSFKEQTQTATEQLIDQTNGGGTESRELKEANQDAELHTMANKIFSQAGISGYAGGEGTVLSVPWNPAFRYRLTYAAAWIWAKAVMKGIATQYLPPNTREFNLEIKKSEWTHPDMGVDDRVKMQLQGHPRKLQPVKRHSSSSRKASAFANSSITIESKPDIKMINRNSTIDMTDPEESKPDFKMLGHKRIIDLTDDAFDSKPDLKNLFNDPLDGIDIEESDVNTFKVDESKDGSSDSETDIATSNHSITMELFLADCDIPYEDVQTRKLLKDAGIISWTDLIPSVQMTESTLITKGVDLQIASRLMDAAKAQYYSQM